ncbi:MAG: hypothetical protein CBD52_000465 [Euryarchaeota archaeon TMED192]|nr:MAG: hypothetical protein CBD52_000465 [Euryarchaeota archaeon TMED192]|tara:strand:- start:349 stop:579 length:231 start_codon:yes stop_codon:yes gene_type:complete
MSGLSCLLARSDEKCFGTLVVSDGMPMQEVVELRKEIEDLRVLVHTLLTVIMEESDGSDQAMKPAGMDGIPRGYSM